MPQQNAFGTKFYHPTLTSVDIIEAVDLAIAAYSNTPVLELNGGWLPITNALLAHGLQASDLRGSGYYFSNETGFLPVLSGTADAVLFQKPNDPSTLAIAFRGSAEVGDWIDDFQRDFDAHLSAFSPFFSAISSFISDPSTNITDIVVSGHSLGAAMVEKFMELNPNDNELGVNFHAVAIASPLASVEDGDARILNIGHEGDPIYALIGNRGGDLANAVHELNLVFDNLASPTAGFWDHLSAEYRHSIMTLLNSQFYGETTRTSSVIISLTDEREQIREVAENLFGDNMNLVLGRDSSYILPNGKELGANDHLVGGNRNDYLEGFSGNDILEGDDSDSLGIGGNDIMAGGAGQDIFLGRPEDLDGDTIVDLEIGDFIRFFGVFTDSVTENLTYQQDGSQLNISFDSGLLDINGTTVNIIAQLPEMTKLELIASDLFATLEVVSLDLSSRSFNDIMSDIGLSSLDAAAEFVLLQQLDGNILNVNFTGSGDAAFAVGDFAIPGQFSLQGGFLLSSGGFPGSANTGSGTTVVTGQPGDSDLNDVAAAAFGGSGTTNDASVLEFDLIITDQSVDGFSFDLVFGSDEYPEFSDSSFVDVAAVFVNGVNVGLFNDDPATPLSVIGANLVNGNFIDNTAGQFATEWDGFSRVLSVRADLIQGVNSIKIGVADTGDTSFDSSLYVTNFEYLSNGATGGGVLIVQDGSSGNDDITAGLSAEEINLVSGRDSVAGTTSQLDGDFITGFSIDDTLVVYGSVFASDDIMVTFGSAILDIDTNQDGLSDLTITLEGDFEGANFIATQGDDGTEVTFQFAPEINQVLGSTGRDILVGTDVADAIRSFSGSYDKMSGGAGADQFIFSDETTNGVRERDVILDYEVGIDEIVLENGASVGSIRQTSSQAVVFLEGDRDAIYVRGEGVTADNLTIITSDVFDLV